MHERLEDLNEVQRLAAIIAILEACTTTAQEMNARTKRELRQLAALQSLPDRTVQQLLTALTITGLLWRPPQFPTRTARYVTTRLGRQVLALLKEHYESLKSGPSL